jgi:hypothetical protein
MKLLDQYKGLNIVTVGDGKTVAFGEDIWGGHVPKRQDPELLLCIQQIDIITVTQSVSDGRLGFSLSTVLVNRSI